MFRIKYEGELTAVKMPVSRVVQVSNDPDSIDISFSEGGSYQIGDPWMTVTKMELGEAWPIKVGDLVTVIIPKVIKVERKN